MPTVCWSLPRFTKSAVQSCDGLEAKPIPGQAHVQGVGVTLHRLPRRPARPFPVGRWLVDLADRRWSLPRELGKLRSSTPERMSPPLPNRLPVAPAPKTDADRSWTKTYRQDRSATDLSEAWHRRMRRFRMESADVQSRRDLPAIVDLVEPTRIGPAAGPCDGRDRGPCGTRALRTCFADEPGKCVPVSRIEQEQGDLGKVPDARRTSSALHPSRQGRRPPSRSCTKAKVASSASRQVDGAVRLAVPKASISRSPQAGPAGCTVAWSCRLHNSPTP